MRARAVVAALAAIGCSDATSPASSTAKHIDALYQQACALGAPNGIPDPSSAYEERCGLLSVLIVAPASGAEPTPLHVITAGTSSTEWRGLVLAYADTGGAFTLGTNNYVFIAYSDPNVTNALVGESVAQSETTPFLVLRDTVTVYSSVGGAPFIDTVSTGARCTDTPGLANPLAGSGAFPPIEYSGSICHIATFTVSMSASFPVSGTDSGFASVQIPQQNVSGIFVINSPYPRYLQRTR